VSEKKMKPAERREVERWKVTALYLSGLSVWQIARDKRVSITIGAIHRLVADRKLESIRIDFDQRLRTLHEMHLVQPLGHAAFIPTALKQNAVIAQAGLDGVLEIQGLNLRGANLARVEMQNRVKLNREFIFLCASAEPVEAEQLVVMEKVGRQVVARNTASCPLEWLYARGKIPQWAYDAGLALRGDFEMATVGGFRGIDPAKDKTDGGMPSNSISDAQALAMERLADARAALTLTFNRIDLPAVWAILEAAAVRGESVREWIALAPKVPPKSGGATSPHIRWLVAGLEPVAFAYGLCPQGDVQNNLTQWKRAVPGGQLRRAWEKHDA
jgi:hypothetical protein